MAPAKKVRCHTILCARHKNVKMWKCFMFLFIYARNAWECYQHMLKLAGWLQLNVYNNGIDCRIWQSPYNTTKLIHGWIWLNFHFFFVVVCFVVEVFFLRKWQCFHSIALSPSIKQRTERERKNDYGGLIFRVKFQCKYLNENCSLVHWKVDSGKASDGKQSTNRNSSHSCWNLFSKGHQYSVYLCWFSFHHPRMKVNSFSSHIFWLAFLLLYFWPQRMTSSHKSNSQHIKKDMFTFWLKKVWNKFKWRTNWSTMRNKYQIPYTHTHTGQPASHLTIFPSKGSSTSVGYQTTFSDFITQQKMIDLNRMGSDGRHSIRQECQSKRKWSQISWNGVAVPGQKCRIKHPVFLLMMNKCSSNNNDITNTSFTGNSLQTYAFRAYFA